MPPISFWLILLTAIIVILSAGFIFLLVVLRREKRKYLQSDSIRRQLEISEKNYRHIFNTAQDGVLIHDDNYNILLANPACTALSGYTPEELYSTKFPQLLSPASQSDLKSAEKNLPCNEKATCCIEAAIVKKNKSELFVMITISPVLTVNRSPGFQCTIQDVSHQKHMEENLRYYLKLVTRAQEEERKRIALELHDETVQYLIVLWRQLETISLKNQGLSEESILLLRELREQTKNVIQSVRSLSHDLRPAVLDRLGLLPAFDHLAEVAAAAGVATKIQVLGAERRLPEEVGLTLFRITQEALRNVVRHSGANRAEIIVEFCNQKVKLKISDNGKGFHPPSNISDLSQKGKLGLVGIQERARLINGELTVTSTPEKGTDILVEVPT